MCFSAAASFVAGSALSAAGACSIRLARMPQELFFASIPLVFAGQQVTEGFIWLTAGHSAYTGMHSDLTYMYLLIAEVVWPVWIPLSLLLLEKRGVRRTVLYVLLLFGMAVSVYLCFHLLTYEVHSEIVYGHAAYRENYRPAFAVLGRWPYVLATVGPFLVSRVPYVWLIGAAIIATYLLARLMFFELFLTSVWCFYAAIVSPLVYLVVRMAHSRRINSGPIAGT